MTRILQPCGTEAAYQRHIRHGEIACQPCLEAAARGRRIRYRSHDQRPSYALDQIIHILACELGVGRQEASRG